MRRWRCFARSKPTAAGAASAIDEGRSVPVNTGVASIRWILLSFLMLEACGGRREQVTRTLDEVGTAVVREDAARLYKQFFGGSGNAFAVIPAAAWPSSFQRFRPRRVGAYPDGFSLALTTDADTEEGLFVIPLHFEARVPRAAADARFERLGEGVYWYAFSR